MSGQSLACNNVNITYFSKYAEDFVKDGMTEILNLGESEMITWIYEVIGHDGYDEDGPESNLYDLYVISFDSESKMYTYHVFHAEQWFTANELVQYFHLSSDKSEKYYPILKDSDLLEVFPLP